MQAAALLAREPNPDEARSPQRALGQPVPLRHAHRDPRRRAARGLADRKRHDRQRGGRGHVTTPADRPPLHTRQDFLDATGVLLVVRDPPPPPAAGRRASPPPCRPTRPKGAEILLAVWADGGVTALQRPCRPRHRHPHRARADRRRRTRPAAGPRERWCWATPRARRTRARPSPAHRSRSMPRRCGSRPRRRARWLLAQAAERFGAMPSRLRTEDGFIRSEDDPGFELAFGELIAERRELQLDPDAPTKAPQDYRVVGRSLPRVDIPAKARGRGRVRARPAQCRACCTAAWCARPMPAPSTATSSATRSIRWTRHRSRTFRASARWW